jgi:CHAT domain-containing protein
MLQSLACVALAGTSLRAQSPARSATEPLRIAREIQRVVDLNGGVSVERGWRAAHAQRPSDPRPLFALATFARHRYRFVEADSLYGLVLSRFPGGGWQVMALIGMGQWRSLGADVSGADTLFDRARDRARALGVRDLEAEATLGLLTVRSRTQGPAAARVLLDRWWDLLGAPAVADSAQRRCQLGGLLEQLGDTTGHVQVEMGARRAEATGAWRVAGSCRLALAQLADRRGFVRAATGHSRQAIRHYERIRYEAGIALANQWFGYMLVRSSRFAEARERLYAAVRASRATGFESVEAWARAGLAELHLRLGEIGDARRQSRWAAASHARRGDSWGLANARLFEGQAARASGDLEGAIARYSEAYAAMIAAKLALNGIPALAAKASLEMRLGRLAAAESTLVTADRIGRTNEAWTRNESRTLRAELAMRRGRLTEADSLLLRSSYAAQWRDGRTSVLHVLHALREAQVAVRRERWPHADSALTYALATIEAWRTVPANEGLTASLAQLRSEWNDIGSLYPDLVAELAARRRVGTAFALLEQVRAREVVEQTLRTAATVADSARFIALLNRGARPAPIATIALVQRSLAVDEAVVSYSAGREGAPTVALVMTRDTVIAHRLSGASITADVQRLLQLLSIGNDAAVVGRRLGAALLDDVLATLPASVRRLLISPDGDLHRVPFDALRTADDRFLIERMTVNIIPSASAWLAMRSAWPSVGQRVVAIGDPSYGALPGRLKADRTPPVAEVPNSGAGLVARTSALDVPEQMDWARIPLPRLAASGVEAMRVTRFGRLATLLRRDAATESSLRRLDFTDVGVLHIASHAIVDAESQGRSALILGAGSGHDGIVTPDVLASLPLRGALVVLSACRTSGGLVMAGEGLRGLVAPLLEAGARAVVATHWAIGDRATIPFVDRFYAALARGSRADDALREVKLTAIREGASSAEWAAFAVIGDGAMRPRLRPSTDAPTRWAAGDAFARGDTLPP